MPEPDVTISHVHIVAEDQNRTADNPVAEDQIRIADEIRKNISLLSSLENKYSSIIGFPPIGYPPLPIYHYHFRRTKIIHIIPDNYIKLNYNNRFLEENFTDYFSRFLYFEDEYYFQSRYVFRLASRLSYFPELERHILRMLTQLEASVDQEGEVISLLKCLLEKFISDGKFYFCLDDTCREEKIVFEDINNDTALDTTIRLFFIQEALDRLSELLKTLKHEIAILKRLIAEAIRIQCIANQILNRVSCNPTPQKKEPPIGGVKVGGEQHDVVRHVVEILYFKQKLAA